MAYELLSQSRKLNEWRILIRAGGERAEECGLGELEIFKKENKRGNAY